MDEFENKRSNKSLNVWLETDGCIANGIVAQQVKVYMKKKKEQQTNHYLSSLLTLESQGSLLRSSKSLLPPQRF